MSSITPPEAVEAICKYLNIDPDSNLGSRKKVSAYDMILSLISVSSTQEASDLLGISRNTLKTIIYNNIDSAGNTNSALTWDLYLLSLIHYKTCTKCYEIKEFQHFYKTKDKSLGILSSCKSCKDSQNTKYRSKNRASYLEYLKQYRISHAGEYRARARKYNLAKAKRVPSWADLEKIKQIYVECPKGFHVDHIIPLQGELVSGLHVENNLQYLLPQDNLSKSNKYIIE